MGIDFNFNFKDFKDFKNTILYLNTHTLVVGFIGDEKGKNGGATISEYAFYVEYGLGKGNVPRPFFRNAQKDIEKEVNRISKALIKKAASENISGEKILKTIGLHAVGLVKLSILSGKYNINKPSTLKNKKGSKPLVDTGSMLNSVTFEIKRR